MQDSPIDVFGLGQCALDYLGTIAHYPPADVKCEFSGLVMQGGGPVATALVALSRWGLSCSYCGVVGDDPFGQRITAALIEEGVDTSNVLVRPGAESQFAFVVAEPGIGRRTIFWRRPTGEPPAPDEIDWSVLARSRLYHTDGLFTESSIAGAERAARAKIPVVVDAGSLRDGMLDLARLSDYFIASEAFARSFLGRNNPQRACRELAGLGPRLTAVTLGARGYLARFDGHTIEAPAYPADAIDTTGCGDVFHAGFIYGLLNGWVHEQSLDFAAWAAARVSLHLGGRTGIPKAEDWNNRLLAAGNGT